MWLRIIVRSFEEKKAQIENEKAAFVQRGVDPKLAARNARLTKNNILL